MMQLHVSGRLVRDPAQKTSANGKAYVHALMTASSSDGEALITLMVFDTELSNLLATLRKGDSLSAIGSASIRAYADKEGKPAAGITLMVNRLMAMTAKEAVPRPRSDGQRRAQGHHQPTLQNLPPIESYNDAIPFCELAPQGREVPAMTTDEFHCRLLALVKQANRADICPACVALELVSGAQGVALQAGLSSLDLTLHGIPRQIFELVEEPQHHHLH